MSPKEPFIDPVCGMKVSKDTAFRLCDGPDDVYFCSRFCLEKYAKERGITACSVEPFSKKRWYLRWTFLSFAFAAAAVLASYVFPALALFRHHLFSYVREIGLAVLLGFFLGGVLERFVPRHYISKLLAGEKKRTVLHAVFLGFLMSACSHGIQALAVQLYKKGASVPVVVSFLLASPWASLPITLLLVGLSGVRALFILFGALLIALVTGLVFQLLDRKSLIESNPHTMAVVEGFSIRADARRRAAGYRFSPKQAAADLREILAGSLALARMTMPWIVFGIVLSSLAGAFVPPDLFRRFMGPTVSGLFATLALATVMEVCSEGTAPLAFEIYRQTGAFGNAFVFLMAGVVTDYTEIAILWTNVGKKTALWLPVITIPQVLVLGVIANRFFG